VLLEWARGPRALLTSAGPALVFQIADPRGTVAQNPTMKALQYWKYIKLTLRVTDIIPARGGGSFVIQLSSRRGRAVRLSEAS
jgi:hypothetical protein